MKKLLGLFVLFFSLTPCFGAGKYDSLAESAEKAFASGDYAKSIEIYESLAQVEKIMNPYLLYNLSNAYYRNGQLGKAVVNIEKAFLLKPCDKDIRHNRQFLRSAAGIAAPEGLAGLSEAAAVICSLNTATILASAAAIVLLLVFSFKIAFRRKVPKYFIAALVFLFILFTALFVLKVYREVFTSSAAALAGAAVRSGPGENNPEIFTLPEGRIVYIEGASGGWRYVEVLPEGFSGWVREGEIEKINE